MDIMICNPCVIATIARTCLHKNMLYVCKQWALVIYHMTDDDLRDAIITTSPRDIPSRLYHLMTFKQKVQLPNLLVKSKLFASSLQHKYRVDWMDIVRYCTHDPSFIYYLLDMSIENGRSFPLYTTPFCDELFIRCEQFRLYTLRSLSFDQMNEMLIGLNVSIYTGQCVW